MTRTASTSPDELGENTEIISALKGNLRRQMRHIRASMTDAERAAASTAISNRLLSLKVLQELQRGGAPLAVYLAKPQEANIDRFIEVQLGRGVAIAAPRAVASDEASFYSLRDVHSTPRPGKYGVRSPLEYAGGKVYAPRQLGIVLAPGLAFDRTGARLGQGGGWYDRVIPSARLSLGICFDCQVIDEIPQEAHDARVDAILTEARLIEVSDRFRQACSNGNATNR